jgi:hypothetical protein
VSPGTVVVVLVLVVDVVVLVEVVVLVVVVGGATQPPQTLSCDATHPRAAVQMESSRTTRTRLRQATSLPHARPGSFEHVPSSSPFVVHAPSAPKQHTTAPARPHVERAAHRARPRASRGRMHFARVRARAARTTQLT